MIIVFRKTDAGKDLAQQRHHAVGRDHWAHVLPVIGINVSESPAIGEKFSRLRDELWWRAREWFEAMNCALPDDETLMGELATVRYGIKSDGKIKVESKDEMKKRGLPSPDVADAFVLTFAEVGRGRQKVRRTRQASWRVT